MKGDSMAKTLVSRFLFLGGAIGLLTASAAEAAGPYQFFSVTPCRIVDTRNPPVPAGTGGPALVAGSPRNFPIAGQCGVPVAAKAAVLNVTLVQPSTDGFLLIWPYNTAMPTVSTINAAAGDPAIANGAIVPLTADPSFNISLVYGTAAPGTAHVILDVTGYFAP
jgi:hypothetical protein